MTQVEDLWNHNMKEAPRGFYVKKEIIKKDGSSAVVSEFQKQYIHALYNGKVYQTRWIPEGEFQKGGKARWEGFTAEQEPEAFIPFPKATKE